MPAERRGGARVTAIGPRSFAAVFVVACLLLAGVLAGLDRMLGPANPPAALAAAPAADADPSGTVIGTPTAPPPTSPPLVTQAIRGAALQRAARSSSPPSAPASRRQLAGAAGVKPPRLPAVAGHVAAPHTAGAVADDARDLRARRPERPAAHDAPRRAAHHSTSPVPSGIAASGGLRSVSATPRTAATGRASGRGGISPPAASGRADDRPLLVPLGGAGVMPTAAIPAAATPTPGALAPSAAGRDSLLVPAASPERSAEPRPRRGGAGRRIRP